MTSEGHGEGAPGPAWEREQTMEWAYQARGGQWQGTTDWWFPEECPQGFRGAVSLNGGDTSGADASCREAFRQSEREFRDLGVSLKMLDHGLLAEPGFLHGVVVFLEPDPAGLPRARKIWTPFAVPANGAAIVLDWIRRQRRIAIRPATAADADWIRDELRREWHSTRIWSLRKAHEADQLPALLAEYDGVPQGLVTYTVDQGGYQGEVITLSSRIQGAGIGARLLDAAEDALRGAGCKRAYLTTTNDNITAIEFYQRRGWDMRAIHRHVMDTTRLLKPAQPRFALNGLPILHEIEFDRMLNGDIHFAIG